MTRLLDTHCHLDAYADPLEVLHAAQQSRVDFVAVTESPDAYRRLRTRLGRRSGVVVGLGLHPASRAAAAQGQLERFFRLASSADWIGEVGLDYNATTTRPEKARQLDVFHSLLNHTVVSDKPLSVHSRGAAPETIRAIAQGRARRVVLHWYSGPTRLLDTALDAECRFSINPAMLGTKGQELIRAIPRNRVLCETDGPYCRTRGRPAQPSDVPDVAEVLARFWQVDPAEAWEQLDRNRQELVGA